MFRLKFRYFKTLINHYFRFWRKRKRGENYLKQLIFDELGFKAKKIEGKVYVLGDSHCGFFGGDESLNFIPLFNDINITRNIYPIFKVFHLDAALAYNLNKPDSQSRALEKTLFLINSGIIPPKSTLMLCFGEIDIRAHVLKQAQKQGISAEQVCDKILGNYLEYIKMLQDKRFKVICWGPIASRKNEWGSSEGFLTYGGEIERNQITEVFNKKLEALADENNFYFCSIFRNLINDDYTTKDGVIYDGCHLAQHNMIPTIKELISRIVLAVDEKKQIIYVNKDKK